MVNTPLTYLRTRYGALSNITPFTYREGWTFLRLVEEIRDKINALVESSNITVRNIEDLTERMLNESEANKKYVDDAVSRVEATLNAFRGEILGMLEELAPAGIAWNPTNGELDPVQKIIYDLWNYLAIHGTFAQQHDDAGLTTAEHDADPSSARRRAVYSQSDPNPEI